MTKKGTNETKEYLKEVNSVTDNIPFDSHRFNTNVLITTLLQNPISSYRKSLPPVNFDSSVISQFETNESLLSEVEKTNEEIIIKKANKLVFSMEGLKMNPVKIMLRLAFPSLIYALIFLILLHFMQPNLEYTFRKFYDDFINSIGINNVPVLNKIMMLIGNFIEKFLETFIDTICFVGFISSISGFFSISDGPIQKKTTLHIFRIVFCLIIGISVYLLFSLLLRTLYRYIFTNVDLKLNNFNLLHIVIYAILSIFFFLCFVSWATNLVKKNKSRLFFICNLIGVFIALFLLAVSLYHIMLLVSFPTELIKGDVEKINDQANLIENTKIRMEEKLKFLSSTIDLDSVKNIADKDTFDKLLEPLIKKNMKDPSKIISKLVEEANNSNINTKF